MFLYNRGIFVVFWFLYKFFYKKGYDVRCRIILWVLKVFIGIYFVIFILLVSKGEVWFNVIVLGNWWFINIEI